MDADEDRLCRKVTLEAKPPGGKPGLPYESKGLQRFEMATQRLVLLHPHNLEIPPKDTIVSVMKASYKALITEIMKLFSTRHCLQISKICCLLDQC